MIKKYYDADCNLGLLDGKTIAIMGYGSQGKFTKAFKDVTQLLPTEYRKNHLANKRNRDSARSLADKTS